MSEKKHGWSCTWKHSIYGASWAAARQKMSVLRLPAMTDVKTDAACKESVVFFRCPRWPTVLSGRLRLALGPGGQLPVAALAKAWLSVTEDRPFHLPWVLKRSTRGQVFELFLFFLSPVQRRRHFEHARSTSGLLQLSSRWLIMTIKAMKDDGGNGGNWHDN